MRRGLIAVGLTGALLASGCDSQPPVDTDDPDLILHGEMPWGDTAIYRDGDRCVTGLTAWGNVEVCFEGNEITGDQSWGDVQVTYTDGNIEGKMPWGGADFEITTEVISGDLPWGDFQLEVGDESISGDLPWGGGELQYGPAYTNTDDMIVVTALVAILSDKV